MHRIEARQGWTGVALAAGALLLLAACGPRIVYDLTPPDTPAGRVCAQQCRHSAALCRQMQQNADQQCRNSHTLMLQNYHACRESGAKRCVMPSACTTSSTAACDTHFRECFAACGGTVTARVIDDR